MSYAYVGDDGETMIADLVKNKKTGVIEVVPIAPLPVIMKMSRQERDKIWIEKTGRKER